MTSPPPSRVQKRAFGVLFAVAAALFLWTVSPIWIPIFLGILLAVVATPLKRRLEKRLGGHPRLLAFTITIVTLAVGVGVFALIAFVVIREVVQFFSVGDHEYAAEASRWLHSHRMTETLKRFGTTPDIVIGSAREYLRQAIVHLTEMAGSLLGVTSHAVITLVFTAIVSYYLLLESKSVADLLLRLSPIPAEETRALMREFRDSCVGILLSIGVVSLFQAVAAGIGFWIFGVPKPLVWGALTGVVSLVPAVGTALVCVPVGILQIATGHVASGIGLLAFWAIMVVFFADYVLRPLVAHGRMRVPDLLVLLGIFGGLEAFGVIGLALGPLFVALFVALLRIYERDYRPPAPLDFQTQ